MRELGPVMRQAREDMLGYHASLRREPPLARLSLGEVPHALVPTHVMAGDLVRILDEVAGPEEGPAVMYRVGVRIGRAQAGAFLAHHSGNGSDPLYGVLAGAFHLECTGLANVDLLVWEPRLEQFAVLWQSADSVSACAAVSARRRTRACHLQAGYSAGWCAEATGLRLEARELACRAEGIAHCRFLVGHADAIDRTIVEPRFHRPTASYSVTPVRAVSAERPG